VGKKKGTRAKGVHPYPYPSRAQRTMEMEGTPAHSQVYHLFGIRSRYFSHAARDCARTFTGFRPRFDGSL